MNAIKKLIEVIGDYQGHGVNHDNQEFNYNVSLSKALNGKGINIRTTATGKDGTLYHAEESLIAPSIQGTEKMWVLMTNAPGVVEHDLVKAESINGSLISFVFGHGDKGNKQIFREEITIDIWSDKSITHRYAWGLPNGEFKDRSGARLTKVR